MTQWREFQLIELGTGNRPAIKAGPFGSALTKATYVKEGYKIYGQEQVIRGDLFYGEYYISPEKYRELQANSVQPGDILLSLVGTAGKLLVITKEAPAGIINPRLIRFSFDKTKINSDFFRYTFETDQVQEELSRQAQGGTMSVLNASILKKIKIALPRIETQQIIASALSDIDALLAKLDQIIAKKRDIKQAAMQELLTGRRRLPGFSAAWVAKRIDKVAPLQRGFDLTHSEVKPGPYPVAYSNGIANHHAEFKAKGPGIATGRSGTIGNVHYIESDYWPHNTSLFVTNFHGNDPKFVYYLFQHTKLAQFSTGSGVPTLNRNDVHAHVVQIPQAHEEQSAIAQALTDMDTEITALEARREKTRLIKQGMMQELLSGRVRLI